MKKGPREIVDEVGAIAAQEREKGKLLELYNGGLPYDRRLLISQVKVLAGSAFESIVEAGKRLILLKEFEGHGGFMKAVEEAGLERQMAQNFMNVALKLANYKTIGNLGKSKLYLIANSLTEDEIEEADQAGLFDKYETMSVRQMREELRKRDADKKDKKESSSRELTHLNKQIEKLQKENERLAQGLPTENEEEMEKALFVELLKMDAGLNMLATVDVADLSPRMLAKVIGAYEYLHKRSWIAMLEVKRSVDPTDEGDITDGEMDMAEKTPVRGGIEKMMSGGRHA